MTTQQTLTPKDAKPNTNGPPKPVSEGVRTDAPKADQPKGDGEPVKKERVPRKVFIVVGEVREFKNAADAEKYVNTDPAAPKDFTVIKGSAVVKTQKVSFR